jgi:nicotinate-nucleotide adenylyltransferase
MRIAFFGGSFDPPHRGHLAVASAAARHFELASVLFAPTGRQPLKSGTAWASYEDRLAMTSLACESDPRFTVSRVDEPRPDGGPNYSVDTLATLRQRYPADQLFNLVGADSFHDLGRWHDPQRLLSIVDWIVVSRPGFDLGEPAGLAVTAAQKTHIHLLDSVHEDVAATHLRERLAVGDPCDDLLPASVSAYIQQQGLYLGQYGVR